MFGSVAGAETLLSEIFQGGALSGEKIVRGA